MTDEAKEQRLRVKMTLLAETFPCMHAALGVDP
jgi:hypothetical protein